MYFLVNNRRSLCKDQKQSRVVWAKLDNPALLLNPEVGFAAAAAWALCLLCFHFQVHNINKTEILIRLYAHICRPKINNSNKVIPVIQIELCIDTQTMIITQESGNPTKPKKNFWRVINSITLLIKFGKW